MAELKRAANGYDYYQQTAPSTEWDVLPQRKPRRRPQARERVEVVYQVHPAMVAKRLKALANCLAALACFVMLLAVVAGYAAISEINLENIALQSNIDELETQVEKLSLEIAVKSEITSLAEVAETEMEMRFPTASQIRYVSLTEPEPITETVSIGAKGEEAGFFERVWQTVNSLFK